MRGGGRRGAAPVEDEDVQPGQGEFAGTGGADDARAEHHDPRSVHPPASVLYSERLQARDRGRGVSTGGARTGPWECPGGCPHGVGRAWGGRVRAL
ncbi:hypothetical protein Sm713_24190 [Streptomyces sp. TS71-3]|nr:hypothetical protein Sm713_24190 [Streptomyces sp. TS71-3]